MKFTVESFSMPLRNKEKFKIFFFKESNDHPFHPFMLLAACEKSKLLMRGVQAPIMVQTRAENIVVASNPYDNI